MGKYVAQVTDHLILPARVRLPGGDEHFLRVAGRRVPEAVPIRLVIDTGSKRTTLIPGIVRYLNARAGDVVRVATSLHHGAARLFWVRLEFPEAGLAPFEHVQIARLAMPPELAQFHGLLGRDLLHQWYEFRYEGWRRRYTIRDTPGPFGWLRRWL
jgi:hypothetical protein